MSFMYMCLQKNGSEMVLKLYMNSVNSFTSAYGSALDRARCCRSDSQDGCCFLKILE